MKIMVIGKQSIDQTFPEKKLENYAPFSKCNKYPYFDPPAMGGPRLHALRIPTDFLYMSMQVKKWGFVFKEIFIEIFESF